MIFINKKEIRDWIKRYKEGQSCKFCNESNPIVLEFHHKNKKDKVMTVSKMVSLGYNIDLIKLEMSKCVVLCSNCHKKLEWIINNKE